MNWDALSAIGTLIGSVTVLVTLILLAIQIGQNTRALRSASFHQVRDSFSEIPLAIAQDSELAGIISRVSANPRSLSVEEILRYEMLLLSIVRKSESAFYQTSEGALHMDSWNGIAQTCRSALSDEIAIAWWNRSKNRFNSAFSRVIDDMISRSI